MEKKIKTIKGVFKLTDLFVSAYEQSLNSNFFLGGDYLKPIYSKKDYQEYSGWVKGKDQKPIDLRKAVLIGANKIFFTLSEIEHIASLPNIDELDQEFRQIDFRTNNNTSFRVNHPADPSYDAYKRIYVQKNYVEEIISLKAIDVIGFEGLKNLIPHNYLKEIRTTEKKLNHLLNAFQHFHTDTLNESLGINLRLLKEDIEF